MNKIIIKQLTNVYFEEAVNLVLKAKLDTKEEIEHHLIHIDAHYVALDKGRVIGLIGWYQDKVNYANEVMGKKFPGEKAYWVGFFVVDEKYRGQGIGYALLKKLEKIIKEKRVNELWVSSVPETKDYYIRQGFKVIMSGKISGNTKFFCVKKLTF
ncbi:GNAT family N-acetyltransferase [Candidatus Microgenomates bacterium]|nr:GNAT family N-acetyltransferase [Candidatus Microgenomates bacterium]